MASCTTTSIVWLARTHTHTHTHIYIYIYAFPLATAWSVQVKQAPSHRNLLFGRHRRRVMNIWWRVLHRLTHIAMPPAATGTLSLYRGYRDDVIVNVAWYFIGATARINIEPDQIADSWTSAIASSISSAAVRCRGGWHKTVAAPTMTSRKHIQWRHRLRSNCLGWWFACPGPAATLEAPIAGDALVLYIGLGKLPSVIRRSLANRCASRGLGGWSVYSYV